MRASWRGMLHGLMLLMAFAGMLLSSHAFGAYSISSSSARLTGVGGAAGANVTVTRFEALALYRYDATSSFSETIYPGHFATADSLSGGTPSTGAALPPAQDRDGNVINLNQNIPLAVTNTIDADETLFMIVDQPQLPASVFGTRSDGRRIMGVGLSIDDGSTSTADYIIALVETSPGSNRFSGYLPTLGLTAPVSAGSTIELRYDDYGDIADSNSDSSPYLIDRSIIDTFAARRFATVAGTPPEPPRGATGLFLSKQAYRSSASQGELIPYQLRLVNSTSSNADDVTIVDELPAGLRLRADSVRIDGQRVEPTISSNGRQFTLDVGTLAPDEFILVDYVVEATAIAQAGPATNRAMASDLAGNESNEASATVVIERGFFDDRAFLMGRVVIGQCGDRSSAGMKDVRLYLEDGSSVLTDDQGRFHLEGIKPGTHVLQLDEASLGPRYQLRQCPHSPRQAGNTASRFIELQGGSLWREEYYLSEKPLVSAHIQQQLMTQVEAGQARITLPIGNGETIFDQVTVKLFLPDSLTPISGSVTLDGEAITDPERGENFYLLTLRPDGKYWSHELALTLALDPSTTQGNVQTIQARTTGLTPEGQAHTVTSINELDLIAAVMQDAVITLRPRFPTMSAELSDEDRLSIQEAARFLGGFESIELEIIGHTDAVPVRRREGRLVNSNQALSEARARSVADELSRWLAIEEQAIEVSGRGASEPIASNQNERGRALNRRVEIHIRTRERVSDASLAVVNGDSGLSRTGSTETRDDTLIAPGISNLRDGMKVSLPVISVTGSLDAQLNPRLVLNGETVPSSQLAMKQEDSQNNINHYTWLGIELPETGEYELELQGIGPFGNTRYRQRLALTRTSDIKSIRLGEQVDNVADGRTPVRVKLHLVDESGRVIESRTDLRLLSGGLTPLEGGARADLLNRQRDVVEVDPDGYAWFDPVTEAGTYRIQLGNDRVTSDVLEISIAPEMRDWILVGFAKGSLGYSTLEDNIEALPDAEEDLYTDGEAAFFAKGRVRGDWLLTAAYDSRKEDGDTPLGGQFRPDQWYVLYGDNTARQNEAASQEKLYLRIERRDFYALFGDFETGLTTTELGKYQRTLTGLKSEYRGRFVSSNVFASQTRLGFARRDIPGDGTSGLYRVAGGNMVPGSEIIRIEVRDRFTNELISSETRSRFIDYSLDYQDGSLFFREPIPVQDASFNPVYIVVEYEIDSNEENITGGGRVAIHDAQREIELGITAVHDGTEGQEGNLAAADLTWQPNERHTIKIEGAQTRQDQVGGNTLDDQAWLLEHSYLSENLDTRVRLEQQGEEFGLGQQADSESGVRQGSIQGRYRLTEYYQLSTEIRRQELLDQPEIRDSLEARLEYDREDWSFYGGVRSANDDIAGQDLRSDLLTAGARRRLLDDSLSIAANAESMVRSDNQNNDYPNRLSLDADYRVNHIASVFAAQEFAWGDKYSSQETRMGVRATPWKGGTLTTDMGHALDEYGPRVFAHAGLYQSVQLSTHWSADLGFDRAQTIRDGTRDPSFDDSRRPPASGTNSDDYTAFSVGAGYQDAQWQWTNRLEHRLSDSSDKWNLFSGFHHRLDGSNTLIGRFHYRDENIHGGANQWETELDVSLVHRPDRSSWWLLNRSRLILDGLEDRYSDLDGQRLVNNLTVNFKPNERHQLAMMYGARYVLESINNEQYTGYTDLAAAEYRFNINRHWDLGARASSLNSRESNVRDDSYGVMVGLSPVKDVWISLGYNFQGFYDGDFDQATSRVAGVVLDFRIKFDQHSASRWRGEEE